MIISILWLLTVKIAFLLYLLVTSSVHIYIDFAINLNNLEIFCPQI